MGEEADARSGRRAAAVARDGTCQEGGSRDDGAARGRVPRPSRGAGPPAPERSPVGDVASDVDR